MGLCSTPADYYACYYHIPEIYRDQCGFICPIYLDPIEDPSDPKDNSGTGDVVTEIMKTPGYKRIMAYCDKKENKSKQVCEIAPNLTAGSKDADGLTWAELRRNIKAIFGYEVRWGEAKDINHSQTLSRLMDATFQITMYIEEVVHARNSATVFSKYLGSNNDGSPVIAVLGSTHTPGEYKGQTDLDRSGMYYGTIQFGKSMDVAGMLHEFGHQLDRYYERVPGTEGAKGSLGAELQPVTGFAWLAMKYEANTEKVQSERFGNMFMTAVAESARTTQYNPTQIEGIYVQGNILSKYTTPLGWMYPNTDVGKLGVGIVESYLTRALSGTLVVPSQ